MDEHQCYRALDLIEEGVILVDAEKKIRFINKPAMQIFGIDLRTGPGHPAGQIKPGDIAVIACNHIGLDDEVISYDDLQLIGIRLEEINKGDAVVAIGQVGAPEGSAIVKTKPFSSEDRKLELECLYNNDIPIKAVVNEINNLLMVVVNEVSYKMSFQQFENLLVIVDPETKQVKFYQSRGYTLRGEAPRYVLRGRPFVAKGTGAKAPEIVGAHISVIKPNSLCMKSLEQVLNGKHEKIKGREYPFNDIIVRLSVYPNKKDNGEIEGCTLVFTDISDVKHLQRKLEANQMKKNAFGNIVGNSQLLVRVKELAHKVSLSNSTVLLLGESGTGKGMFARAIHDNSKRADKPFVSINMAAIPATLLESELFGYEEGAFTGARKAGKPGKFQMANGGTIFLDEIGDLDHSLQAKLLQVLQEGLVYPVGSIKPVEVDVRVIAASHRNLEEEVKKGSFREDLFYRLNVITLEIPPLRWRKEDIKDLIGHILPRLNAKVGKKIEDIEEDVYHLLLAYEWPGNVRELENVLESAVNLADGMTITLKDLPQRFLESVKDFQKVNEKGFLSLKSASAMAEKQAIELALSLTNGNRSRAAALLNIGRTAFYNKLKKYNIKRCSHK